MSQPFRPSGGLGQASTGLTCGDAFLLALDSVHGPACHACHIVNVPAPSAFAALRVFRPHSIPVRRWYIDAAILRLGRRDSSTPVPASQ